MPLFGKSDEAEKRYKKASKLMEGADKEHDMEEAIHLLEEAAMIKPHEEKYRENLEEANKIRANLGKKFLMPVEDVFLIKERDIAVRGIVQQGIIRDGDEVWVRGVHGDKKDTVVLLQKGTKDSRPFTITRAIPGDEVSFFLKKLSSDDVELGDTIEKEA
jgi:translation elongation factor EF-Tu-like GTPase